MKLYHLCVIVIHWVSLIKCSDTNGTDVFIKYSGHSDLDRPVKNPASKPEAETKIENPVTENNEPVAENTGDDATDGIVFIPNDKPAFRNEDVVYNDRIKIDDVIETRRIGGVMKDAKIRITETESPKDDILFVSGKNKENIEKPVAFAKKPESQDSTLIKKTKVNKKKLNCANLNCNNTVNSVCGGREENKLIKYRLFLNECFFRKVNCGFQNAVNRYEVVPIESCKNIGAHYLTRPYEFKPIPLPAQKVLQHADIRRSFSSRRSLNMGVDGSFCGHSCPAYCTEDYDPQCAVSSSGQRRVFLNHCKLDYNSCLYKVVWHRRPLSECVGGKKADMTQNRGFIGWMQRVGIVDRKGKLVLS